ncbi:hypothetical protein QFC22_000003 [Naganishia vaughanmartiniae]|uniref:Uncharacterized protein n=1 Tax=Naganishia vaughanmartiniae TaxID=1424756 RepID=A0ACC2XLW4_9TREE|nr:hypothetical protein QFC22_000003 [Naganishia vaughanmartiniae]
MKYIEPYRRTGWPLWRHVQALAQEIGDLGKATGNPARQWTNRDLERVTSGNVQNKEAEAGSDGQANELSESAEKKGNNRADASILRAINLTIDDGANKSQTNEGDVMDGVGPATGTDATPMTVDDQVPNRSPKRRKIAKSSQAISAFTRCPS